MSSGVRPGTSPSATRPVWSTASTTTGLCARWSATHAVADEGRHCQGDGDHQHHDEHAPARRGSRRTDECGCGTVSGVGDAWTACDHHHEDALQPPAYVVA